MSEFQELKCHQIFSITTSVCFAPCSLPARWLIASQPEAGKETGLISSGHNSGIGQITQGDLEIIFSVLLYQ